MVRIQVTRTSRRRHALDFERLPTRPDRSRSVWVCAICAGAWLTISASDLTAQAHPVPPDSTPRTLEPLRPTVARPLVIGSASALTVALDSIARPPAPSLGELIRDMPLIRARDNSRGETHLTLRGSESRQVSVTLDGIPLTIGWDNRTDLSVIPLSGAHRLATVRGLTSLLAGPNVLGGVVGISVAPATVPSSIDRPFSARASVAGGRSGAFDLGLRHGFGLGNTRLLLTGGGGYRSRDHQPMSNRIQQPPTAAPGERLNSDFDQWNAFLAGRIENAAGTWGSLSSMAFGAERGVPPELHVVDPRKWRLPTTRRWVTVLGMGTTLGGASNGRGTVGLRAAADVGDAEIEEYETLAYRQLTGRETGRHRTLTLKADMSHAVGRSTLRMSATGADTRYDESLEPGGDARYRQRFLSVAAESEIPLGGSPETAGFGLVFGASVDGSDTPETGARPGRAAIWDWGAKAAGTYVFPGKATRVHAGLSRRTRAPSLRELYSGALGRFVVNPDLGPETLTASEVGITYGRSDFELQAVGFHHRLEDAVVRVSAGDGRFRRVNRDRVLATGLEFVGSATWGALSTRIDLTLQDVRLEDPTAPDAQRQPEYQPWIAGSMAIGGRLPLDLRGQLRLAHVGSQYCVHPDLARDVSLQASTWADVELARTWRLGGSRSRWLRVVGGVQNLADAAVYDQCGLPAPGRRLILSLEIG